MRIDKIEPPVELKIKDIFLKRPDEVFSYSELSDIYGHSKATVTVYLNKLYSVKFIDKYNYPNGKMVYYGLPKNIEKLKKKFGVK